uniref:Uncharacterized protein n=1 Tax=Branchiostoma floridae TaxID=7739 RepID=C3ZJR1_BRAFL|eukprot:XP_002591185.1 hypothetical protein BRAFLDRAFT_105387 [Branchiostoma floridae]
MSSDRLYEIDRFYNIGVLFNDMHDIYMTTIPTWGDLSAWNNPPPLDTIKKETLLNFVPECVLDYISIMEKISFPEFLMVQYLHIHWCNIPEVTRSLLRVKSRLFHPKASSFHAPLDNAIYDLYTADHISPFNNMHYLVTTHELLREYKPQSARKDHQHFKLYLNSWLSKRYQSWVTQFRDAAFQDAPLPQFVVVDNAILKDLYHMHGDPTSSRLISEMPVKDLALSAPETAESSEIAEAMVENGRENAAETMSTSGRGGDVAEFRWPYETSLLLDEIILPDLEVTVDNFTHLCDSCATFLGGDLCLRCDFVESFKTTITNVLDGDARTRAIVQVNAQDLQSYHACCGYVTGNCPHCQQNIFDLVTCSNCYNGLSAEDCLLRCPACPISRSNTFPGVY